MSPKAWGLLGKMKEEAPGVCADHPLEGFSPVKDDRKEGRTVSSTASIMFGLRGPLGQIQWISQEVADTRQRE